MSAIDYDMLFGRLERSIAKHVEERLTDASQSELRTIIIKRESLPPLKRLVRWLDPLSIYFEENMEYAYARHRLEA